MPDRGDGVGHLFQVFFIEFRVVIPVEGFQFGECLVRPLFHAECERLFRLLADVGDIVGEIAPFQRGFDQGARGLDHVRDAVMACDAVHLVSGVLIQVFYINRRVEGDIFVSRSIGIVHANPGDILLLCIGCNEVNLVFDVPVDTAPQTLALTSAAGMHQQVNIVGQVVLSGVIPVNDPQAVIGELFGEVAAFAGFACGAHALGANRVLELTQRRLIQQLEMARFANKLLVDHVAPNMAVHARDACMRRNQVCVVFGRHCVACRATEIGGIAILPPRWNGQQDGNYHENSRDRQPIAIRRAARGGKEESSDSPNHLSSFV